MKLITTGEYKKGGDLMKLMTPGELMRSRLTMKMNTLFSYQKTSGKQIPYIKVGGLLRFDPKRIDEWRQERSVSPIEAA